MNRLVIALSLLASSLPAAHAATFSQLQPAQSAITFTFSQMGVAMEGRFKKFSSQLNFDPAQPATAKVAVDVDLASIDTGTEELDVEAIGKDWFNVKGFPVARFASSSVTSQGGGRYSVAGQLTIKGRSRNVTVPATFTSQGNLGTFTGAFTIRRGDFAIGEGSWSAFDTVANDVQVRFRIVAAGK
jgi:polyisoprenoid-binding protein YceI